MHRFYSAQPLTEIMVLHPGPQFHQITNVFRAKKGDKIIFFEAYGDDKVYEVINVSKKQITLTQKEIIPQSTLQGKRKSITLFQSFPNKIATMELIVQKMVEIGINTLTFFPSEHSQIHEMPVSKIARLSFIAQEALEQSGGNVPITITYLSETTEKVFLGINHRMQHIIGYPGIKDELKIDTKGDAYALWIGPEGGWSDREKIFFSEQECHFWTFNHRVLRLETASIIGAGILSYMLE